MPELPHCCRERHLPARHGSHRGIHFRHVRDRTSWPRIGTHRPRQIANVACLPTSRRKSIRCDRHYLRLRRHSLGLLRHAKSPTTGDGEDGVGEVVSDREPNAGLRPVHRTSLALSATSPAEPAGRNDEREGPREDPPSVVPFRRALRRALLLGNVTLCGEVYGGSDHRE